MKYFINIIIKTIFNYKKNVIEKLDKEVQKLNNQKRSLEIEQDNLGDSKRLMNQPLSPIVETLRLELVKKALTVGCSVSAVPE